MFLLLEERGGGGRGYLDEKESLNILMQSDRGGSP